MIQYIKEKKYPHHIYVKIFLSILLILGLNSFISSFLLIKYTGKDFDSNIKSKLESYAIIIRELADHIGFTEDTKNELSLRLHKIGNEIKCRITIIKKDGTVIFDSMKDSSEMENHLSRHDVVSALNGKTEMIRALSHTLKVEMLYLSIPLYHNDEISGVIRVSKQQSEIRKLFISSFYKSLLFGNIIGTIIAVIIAYRVASGFSKPIELIKDAASNIASGNYDYKINVESRDELGLLACYINSMSEKIKESFAIQKEEAQRLSAILSGIDEPLILIGGDGVIYLANVTFCKLFSLNPAEIKNRKFHEIIKHNEIKSYFDSVLSGSGIESGSCIMSLDNGGLKHFELTASLIKHEANALSGVVFVFHNITLLKEMDNMRREFADNASHELKTPLSAIFAVVETLIDKEPKDTDIRLKFYSTIMENAQRLHTLVNDLLDLSEIEQKRTGLEMEYINLSDFILELLETYSPSIQSKNHKIHFGMPEDIIEIRADRKNLLKAVGNVIDNAIRYTEQGGDITVDLTKTEKEAIIKISDNGIGIPQNDLSRIFERFYRVDKARSIKLGGTGLGLSITKHIIEAHKGTVKVSSESGKGSVFTITFPV